jgi:LuxR family quorum sensing-dependent transcriptional regulator
LLTSGKGVTLGLRGGSVSTLQRALDFIQSAEQSASMAELEERLQSVLEDFGVSQCTILALDKNPANGAKRPVSLTRASDRVWAARYGEMGYFNVDPLLHEAINRPNAFSWSDINPAAFSESAKRVCDECKDVLDIEGSFVVPTPDQEGFGGVVAMFHPGRSPDASMRKALKLIAVYASERAKELNQIELDRAGWDTACPLTPRQREVLAFTAAGKSDWEMGAIIGISENTVNRHMEDAKARLKVVTRAQAVALAVHRGWVSL